MSSKTRKKRGRQEISEEPSAPVDEQLVLPFPPLPNDVLWKIALFSKNHLRLRLVSSAWNEGVINAHCDPDCGCKSCTCTSPLSQFSMKRFLLPWISKWNFKITTPSPSSAAVLTEMMFQKNQNGSQSLRVPSSFLGREIPPITSCTLQISDEVIDDVNAVFLTSQIQHLTNLSIKVLFPLSAANRRSGLELFGKLKHLKYLELIDWRFDYAHDGHDGQNDFRMLVSSFPDLETLIANGCEITDAGLTVFSSSAAAHLKCLRIGYNSTITAAGIQSSICFSPHLTQLTDLSLLGSEWGDEVVDALCRSPSITSLQNLWLSDCGLHDVSIQSLISSPNMKQITGLDIADNDLTSAGLTSLLSAVSTPNSPLSLLQDLDVLCSRHGISGSELLPAVTQIFSPFRSEAALPKRSSNLVLSVGSRRGFDHEAIEALASIPLMQFVSKLEISRVDQFASSAIFGPGSYFSSLDTLKLTAPRITWYSLQRLASSPLASKLRSALFQTPSLSRVDGNLDDNCCKLLSHSNYLTNLQKLCFGESTMSVSVGLITLLSSANLSSLRKLNCDRQWEGFDSHRYEPFETMTEAEAATQIVHLLRTNATDIDHLRFPNTAFAAAVRDIVKKAVHSVTIE